MCNTYVLAIPNFSKTFLLEFDALGKGLGTTLMQEGCTLAFTTKNLSDINLCKSTYEKDIISLLEVLPNQDKSNSLKYLEIQVGH